MDQIPQHRGTARSAFTSALLWLVGTAMLALSFASPVRAQAGCTAGACISAGPRLVAVDSTQGPVLNLLFTALLPGTTVNVSVLDWNALAQSDIKLNALITQLGTNLSLSDTTQILNADITLAQLRAAMVQVAQADGNTALVNALNVLPLGAPGLTGTIKLVDFLKITLPPGSLATIDLDVLDFLTGAVQVYNFRNVLTTPTPITVNTAALGLAGVANVQLWLQVVEPPVYVCGPVNTGFHTGAIRVKLNLDVVQGLDLAAALAALNSLGLANVTLTQSVLTLQLYADIARAEGTITAVNALAGTVSFNARPGLVNFYIGTVPDATFFNRSIVITNAVVTPVQLTTLNLGLDASIAGIGLVHAQVPLTVTVRAAATGSPALQAFSVNAPYPQTRTASSGTVSAGTLVVDLLNTLDIQITSGTPVVTLLGIPIPLPPALVPIINGAVSAIQGALGATANVVLQPVLTALLGGLVDNVLALLGIRVGNAVFTVEGIAQSCVAVLQLQKTVVPAANPGVFNLSISLAGAPLATASNVGDGGSTGTVVSTPGSSYDFAETAGTATTLAPYVSTWACIDQASATVSSGTGTSFAVVAPAASTTPLTITCRITNRIRQSDLSIVKADGSGSYTPGGTATYVLTVSNAGPDAVVGAAVNDTLPAGVTLTAPWTCVTATGACSAASGGVIGGQTVSLTVDLTSGGTATITVPVGFSANPGAY